MYFGRGKRQIIADYTSVDIYKFYKDRFGEKAMDKKKFGKIWDRFISIRLQMAIFENVQLTMPFRMGELGVRIGAQANKITKSGKFRFKTNWGETKKKWKELYPDLTDEEIRVLPNKPLVYVSNETTDGKKVYWRWDKMTCNYKNNTVYRIRMNRVWSRMLSAFVQKTDKIQYYENNR